MMNKTLCALAVLAATALNAQAQSVDVSVKGTILPTSCNPVLSGGGNIDFGTIQAGELKWSEFNKLAAKTVTITVTCDAPTQVALAATSTRKDTVAGTVTENGAGVGSVVVADTVYDAKAGLGLAGTAKIGGYSLEISNMKIASAEATLLTSDDNATTWTAVKTADSMFKVDSQYPRLIAAATTGATTPAAIENMTADLTVRGYINQASALDLSKNVILDGQTNIELRYL